MVGLDTDPTHLPTGRYFTVGELDAALRGLTLHRLHRCATVSIATWRISRTCVCLLKKQESKHKREKEIKGERKKEERRREKRQQKGREKEERSKERNKERKRETKMKRIETKNTRAWARANPGAYNLSQNFRIYSRDPGT